MKNVNELKVGFVSSLLLSILTIVRFGFAMIAIPPSGPYWDLLKYYPRDYRFEVAAITIDWLAIIIIGILKRQVFTFFK